jgi:hypothetical protein
MGKFYDTYQKLVKEGAFSTKAVDMKANAEEMNIMEPKENKGMDPKIGLKQLSQYAEYAKADAEATRKLWEETQATQPGKVYAEEKPQNIRQFEMLGEEKLALYTRKNADYGDSFNKSLDEDGLLVAKIRIMDKVQRFCQLIKNPAQVTEEKLRETLIDLSNYTDMTIMWLDVKELESYGVDTKKHNDALDAMARAVCASGADWDGDFVNGQYINLKEGIIGEKIPQEDMFTTPEAKVDTMTGADFHKKKEDETTINNYNFHIHGGADLDSDQLESMLKNSMDRIMKNTAYGKHM